MNAITGITATIFLKKVNYSAVVENYSNKKYIVMPEFESMGKKYMGTLIYENDKIKGFKVINDKQTLIIYHKTPVIGLCAHCEMDTLGICAFGIPEIIDPQKTSDGTVITIHVNGETCSLECTLAVAKKLGRTDLNLHPKYMDVNSMIIILFILFFPTIGAVNEAPGLAELVKFNGHLTPSAFKSKLHFYYHKEDQLVGSPKVVLKLQ